MKTQKQMFNEERAKIADRDSVMIELLFGRNQITDDELRKMIAKDPARYLRYKGYLNWHNKDENGARIQ